MQNVFIIHGTYGSPEENWFPWLKDELEKSDFVVYVPKFPTPKNQSLVNWLDVIREYAPYITNDSIIDWPQLGLCFHT